MADHPNPQVQTLGICHRRLGDDVITAIPAYGHTPGHTAWLITSSGDSLLIWGDVVQFSGRAVSPSGRGRGVHVDGAGAIATRARLVDMAATDRLTVARMHLDFPVFGHVVQAGIRLRSRARGVDAAGLTHRDTRSEKRTASRRAGS